MIFDDKFLYGAHYHRPPNPPADQHEFHLNRINDELGFNVVKFRIQWNWTERTRGQLYLDEVHRMLDLCEKNGLNAICEINLESAPYWLEEEHPDTRYINTRGQAMELGAYDVPRVVAIPVCVPQSGGDL